MNLEEKFKQGKFVVTAEAAPPKGVDMSEFEHNADLLKGRVDNDSR